MSGDHVYAAHLAAWSAWNNARASLVPICHPDREAGEKKLKKLFEAHESLRLAWLDKVARSSRGELETAK